MGIQLFEVASGFEGSFKIKEEPASATLGGWCRGRGADKIHAASFTVEFETKCSLFLF